MPWLELQRPKDLLGKERPVNFRCDYPYHAGLALVSSGAAIWVEGPHKVAEEEDPEDPEKVDPGEPQEEDSDEESGAPEEEDPEEATFLHPDDFAGLPLEEQKDLIRVLELTEKADLRKPLEMAIAYGEWYVSQ